MGTLSDRSELAAPPRRPVDVGQDPSGQPYVYASHEGGSGSTPFTLIVSLGGEASEIIARSARPRRAEWRLIEAGWVALKWSPRNRA